MFCAERYSMAIDPSTYLSENVCVEHSDIDYDVSIEHSDIGFDASVEHSNINFDVFLESGQLFTTTQETTFYNQVQKIIEQKIVMTL